MIFNDIGVIANQCRLDIPKHFPFVKLGNRIVMPNHVHGIVVIDKPINNPVQLQNLPSIIRRFKSGVTIQARSINPKFGWQPRYNDHIIRNKKSNQRISDYIANNPVNRKNDAFNKF